MYAKYYNLEHPEKQVSIFGKMWNHYGDYRLAMILEQATRETATSLLAIGSPLQIEHMSYWRDGKVSARQLDDFLQPDWINSSLLTGRAYDCWNVYFSTFVPDESTKPYNQLHHTFGDARLSSPLISVRRSQKTATLAEFFQLEFENDWLSKARGQTMVEVCENVVRKERDGRDSL